MGKWIKGDLHIHTHNCNDGTLPVDEIIKRCKQYVDFIGISGHAYNTPDCLEKQYDEILKARKDNPDMPIFHTAEQNFPIERHVMYITTPDNDEFMLQRRLIHNFNRWDGHVGLEEALKELEFVKENWGEEKIFMIFNHPNDPDVSYENFAALANANDIFKVIACVDRRVQSRPGKQARNGTDCCVTAISFSPVTALTSISISTKAVRIICRANLFRTIFTLKKTITMK